MTDMWKLAIILAVVAAVSRQDTAWHSDVGPWVQATKGEIWPNPYSRVVKKNYYFLRASNFEMRVSLSIFFSLFHHILLFISAARRAYDVPI